MKPEVVGPYANGAPLAVGSMGTAGATRGSLGAISNDNRLQNLFGPSTDQELPQPEYGVGDDEMAQVTREELEAKLEAVEARSETRFAEVIGEIKALNAKVDAVHGSTSGTKTTVIVTGIATCIAIAALLVAVLNYGQQWFGIGVTTRDIIRATVQEMKPVSLPSNGKSN